MQITFCVGIQVWFLIIRISRTITDEIPTLQEEFSIPKTSQLTIIFNTMRHGTKLIGFFDISFIIWNMCN